MKISKEFARLLIARGDMLKLMRKDTLYRYVGQEELRIEMMYALYECKLHNLKMDGKSVTFQTKCLRKDLVGTPELDRFVGRMSTDARYLTPEQLKTALEIDEMIINRGGEKFIVFHYERELTDNSIVGLYSLRKDILKKAIELFGIERFKKLVMECPIKNYGMFVFFMNEFGYDDELLKYFYENVVRDKILYWYYSSYDYNFDFFKEAYEKGLISKEILNELLNNISIHSKTMRRKIENNPKLERNIRVLFDIICNDDTYKEYWEIIKKEFKDFVEGFGFKCYEGENILDIFEI